MLEGGNSWACDGPGENDKCNIKGPRFGKGPLPATHPGFQTHWSSGEDHFQMFHCTFDAARPGECGHAEPGETTQCDIGCRGGQLVRSGHNIVIDDWEGNWSREEFCFDHNPNGGNHLWARARRTMITGPKAGQQMLYGPGRGVTPISTANIGTTNRIWTNTVTDTGTRPPYSTGDRFVSYGIVMMKSPADQNWWIGPASEIEGGEGTPGSPPSTPTPTATPTPPDPGPLADQLATVTSTGTGGSYRVQVGLDLGDTVYTDRSYTYGQIPSQLLGANYVQTPNDDTRTISGDVLTLTALETVTVYIGHDDRIATKPPWLSNFAATGLQVVTQESSLRTFTLYAKTFDAGPIVLGANKTDPSSAGSMYFVIITAGGTEMLGKPGKPYVVEP